MGQVLKKENIGVTGLGKITREQIIEKKVESNDSHEIPDRVETSEMSGPRKTTE